MSNNYVQVPANSNGTKMQTFENTVSGNTVDSEAVTLVRSSDNTEIGTSGQPLRVDPVGTTTQPVSIAAAVTVEGNVANGSAVSGANDPVLIAGSDGTDVRTLATDGSGFLKVIGVQAAGSATTGNPVQIAGTDGTDVRGILTDTSGQVKVLVENAAEVIGAAASGSAVAGNPVLVGGQDGTDARSLLTDNTGQLKVLIENTPAVTLTSTTVTGTVTVVGDAASGSAVAGNPVLVGGSDGTDARTLSTNSSGQLVVVGAGTAGSNSGGVVSVQGIASGTALPVSGTFWQTTQPVSGTITAVTSITNAVKVEGNAGGAFDAATNAAPPANAVQVGMVAATSLPSAYTATDLAAPMTDKFGRQVVLTAGMRDILGATGTTITSTTAATTVVAAVSSTYCDITSLTITNSSGTATLLTLSDGTNSYIFSAAAGPGWGITIPFNPPLPATSTNTTWTVTCGTSVASIYVVAQYVKNK